MCVDAHKCALVRARICSMVGGSVARAILTCWFGLLNLKINICYSCCSKCRHDSINCP